MSSADPQVSGAGTGWASQPLPRAAIGAVRCQVPYDSCTSKGANEQHIVILSTHGREPCESIHSG